MRSCYELDCEETIDNILCNRCKHLCKGINCDTPRWDPDRNYTKR